MAPILTIVVSTYNRSDWLRGCLASLEPQCQDDSVEVLVVDNNSTDSTASVVREFSDKLPHVKYILERAQGLSHARNRGITEALGRIVAYIDDDARAHLDWVSAIIGFFDSAPDASGVGGPYYAFSSVSIPPWFPKDFGMWSLGGETRKMRKDEWINGTNMAFKKQALIEAGGFDVSLGMAGDKVSYGEETNLMLRMSRLGMQFYYCAEMRVDHAILPYKLKLRWLLSSSYANGYGGSKTFGYTGGMIGYLPVLARQVVASFILFLFCNERYIKTRVYRSMSSLLYHVGFLVRLVGL